MGWLSDLFKKETANKTEEFYNMLKAEKESGKLIGVGKRAEYLGKGPEVITEGDVVTYKVNR